MLHTAVGLLIEILIQTAALFGVLWVVIKGLRLEANYPGLIASTILVVVLEAVMARFIGSYLSTLLLCIVLFPLVWRTTSASQLGSIFPVVVGGATVLLINLFVVSSLLSGFRPQTNVAKNTDRVRETASRTIRETNAVVATNAVPETAAIITQPRDESASNVPPKAVELVQANEAVSNTVPAAAVTASEPLNQAPSNVVSETVLAANPPANADQSNSAPAVAVIAAEPSSQPQSTAVSETAVIPPQPLKPLESNVLPAVVALASAASTPAPVAVVPEMVVTNAKATIVVTATEPSNKAPSNAVPKAIATIAPPPTGTPSNAAPQPVVTAEQSAGPAKSTAAAKSERRPSVLEPILGKTPLVRVLGGYVIQFLLQTVLLTVALLFLLKMQKLEFNFGGLLVSAAIASMLEIFVQNIGEAFLGIYLASAITAVVVCPVLMFCIAKLTHGEAAPFPVFLGYALQFGMSLFLMGALMGDSKPSAKHVVSLIKESRPAIAAARSVAPVAASTNEPVVEPKTGEKPAGKSLTKTRTVEPQPEARTRTTGKISRKAKYFALKSVTMNGQNSMAMFSTGVKTYTLFLDETISVTLPDGDVVQVRCESVGNNSALLIVEHEDVPLAMQ